MCFKAQLILLVEGFSSEARGVHDFSSWIPEFFSNQVGERRIGWAGGDAESASLISSGGEPGRSRGRPGEGMGGPGEGGEWCDIAYVSTLCCACLHTSARWLGIYGDAYLVRVYAVSVVKRAVGASHPVSGALRALLPWAACRCVRRFLTLVHVLTGVA